MPSARSLFVVFLISGILIGVGIGAAVFYHLNQTPIVLPASKPRNLGAISGIGNVTLNWTVPSDDGGSPITDYKVYRQLSTSSLLITVSADTLSFIDYTGTPGTTYVYNVQATNSAGGGFPSDPVAAASRENTPITPTGSFIGNPMQLTVGYKLTFGVFTPSTNFTDCKVVVSVDGMASAAQTIVLIGNAFTAPSDIAINWTDLAFNNAINVGDYLTITGGNLTAPTALPTGSYVVTIIFTSTGGAICSQEWTSTIATPMGYFLGTPTNQTAGYKLQFGVIDPQTTWNSCKLSLVGTAASSFTPAAITMASGTATVTVAMGTIGAKTYTVVITDLAADGIISQGDYAVVTSTGGFATGNYTLNLLYTQTGGSICSQSWTV